MYNYKILNADEFKSLIMSVILSQCLVVDNDEVVELLRQISDDILLEQQRQVWDYNED